MESNLGLLSESVSAVYKQILYRSFFFNFLNQVYEDTLFKQASGTSQTSSQVQEKKQNQDEHKLDDKLEQALEMSKKVVASGRAKKMPVPQAKRPSAQVKKQETLPKAQLVLPHFQSNFELSIQEELMGKYQEARSRTTGVIFGSKGGIAQARKGELAAKKGFLTNLRAKFARRQEKSNFEIAVIQALGSYKLLTDIKSIITERQSLNTVGTLINLPISRFRIPDDALQLFKAFYQLTWAKEQLSQIDPVLIRDINMCIRTFKQQSSNCLNGEQIIRIDSFKSEKGIHSKLLKACTNDESREIVEQYKLLDSLMLQKEINKFLFDHKDQTKSVPELRVLHSLLAKKGKVTCTLEAENN